MYRDTIFQNLGLKDLKSWSHRGTLKSLKIGMSWPYLKVRFKIE